MSGERHHDAVVIGAGPAGYVCAIRLGQLGVDTLLVDAEHLGGVCLNVGCIPSKALIHASKEVAHLRHAGDMGIDAELKGIDLGKMQEWKSGIVKKLTGGVGSLVKGAGGQVLMGRAKLTSPTTLDVTGEDGTVTKVTTKNIVLATGSRPIEIPGFSFDEEFVLSSTGALALTKLPEKMIVIGGGYIGLELGSCYAQLGTEVTVVEMMDQILPGFSPDVVKFMSRALKKQGVKVILNAKAKSQSAGSDGKPGTVTVEVDGADQELPADVVVVAVGRRPNSEGLGLEEIGVNVERGFVPADSAQRTNVPSIFCIGDLAGQPMLAHAGSKEGEVAAEVIAGRASENDARCVPAVVFTHPEIATVGLFEHEAKEQGRDIKVGKFPYAALGRALSTNATDGYVKLLADAETDLVLGAEIVGDDASALIAEVALAIEMGATAEDLALTIHAHPTLPEGIMEAAKAVHGEAIHAANPKRRR
ncbi:MAG: dihydrolipoyl dehydrogenase [Acidobacteriota bacterium]